MSREHKKRWSQRSRFIKRPSQRSRRNFGGSRLWPRSQIFLQWVPTCHPLVTIIRYLAFCMKLYTISIHIAYWVYFSDEARCQLRDHIVHSVRCVLIRIKRWISYNANHHELVSCPECFLSFVLGKGKEGSGGSSYVVLCNCERPKSGSYFNLATRVLYGCKYMR